MLISRSGLIRGLAGLGVGAALAPAAAQALPTLDPTGRFAPDIALQGPLPWTEAPATGPAPLRFAVIGDHTGLARPGVFKQGLKQVSWLQPDFILSVGDLIEGYLDDRQAIDRQWAEVDAAVAATGLPFIYTVGNHDVANATTLDAWRERRGAGHYAFTYNHPQAWLVLAAIFLAAILIRHFFNLRHKGRFAWPYPLAAILILLTVFIWLAPAPLAANTLGANGQPVTAAEVQPIIAARCAACHGEKPTLMPAPPATWSRIIWAIGRVVCVLWFCRLMRRTVFSTMTTAPSTTMPKSSAPKESRFAGIWLTSSQMEANSNENGMVRATIRAARMLPRNRRRTMVTRIIPSPRLCITVCRV